MWISGRIANRDLWLCVLAAALGITLGVLFGRSREAVPDLPGDWQTLAPESREQLVAAGWRFQRLTPERRSELVALTEMIAAEDSESLQVAAALEAYHVWLSGLEETDRQLALRMAPDERLDFWMASHLAANAGSTSPPPGGDPSRSEGPSGGNRWERPQLLTDQQLAAMFRVVERELPLTADEQRQSDRLSGANKGWYVLALALREAPYSRPQQSPVWPSVQLARKMVDALPPGPIQRRLQSQDDLQLARWVGRAIATRMARDAFRLMRELPRAGSSNAEGNLERQRADIGVRASDQRFADTERLNQVAEVLGLSATDVRRTIRWVMQTAARGRDQPLGIDRDPN